MALVKPEPFALQEYSLLLGELRIEEFPVEAGDVLDAYTLWTLEFAGTCVGAASGRPWGSNASELTLAATNSIAEPFLQVATQAPQPTQAAASMLFSAFS